MFEAMMDVWFFNWMKIVISKYKGCERRSKFKYWHREYTYVSFGFSDRLLNIFHFLTDSTVQFLVSFSSSSSVQFLVLSQIR